MTDPKDISKSDNEVIAGCNVMFMGASVEQINWGGNDDPNKFLKVGDTATIESIEIRSSHTKVRLIGIEGRFNSVSFRRLPDYINKNLKKVSKTDLKKVLHDLRERQEAERRQAQIDLNKAFNESHFKKR